MDTWSILEKFNTISLCEMDNVKLMNRIDRKYWFNICHLNDLLLHIYKDYYVLKIENQYLQPYSTLYYDTPENHMYLNHHRGKLNRYKIRRRNYVLSQSSFLEIKFKNNKEVTIKERIPTIFDNRDFSSLEDNFILENSPYNCKDLACVLDNTFSRIMLVSKEFNERCTIDLDIEFTEDKSKIKLSDLVVVEVKTQGRTTSRIIEEMNKLRLKPSGFSKYCMGRSMLNDNLKRGLFKEKHRQIEKITNLNNN